MKGKYHYTVRKAMLFVLVLCIAAAALAGCQRAEPVAATTEPTETGDAPWQMKAVLVNDKGEVLETTELTATVRVWDQGEGRDSYKLTFDYPENIYNSVAGVMPTPDSETPYTCCAGIGYEKGDAQATDAIQFYLGLDLEKKCFIMDMDDGQDVYLIAYTSSDDDAAALWAHFQDFLDMVPAEFPTIIG